MKGNCEVCGIKIDVPETALKLCDKCFDEECECGHKRATHLDGTIPVDIHGKPMMIYKKFKGNTSCVYTYSLHHKTKRGQYCPCKKFKLKRAIVQRSRT